MQSKTAGQISERFCWLVIARIVVQLGFHKLAAVILVIGLFRPGLGTSRVIGMLPLSPLPGMDRRQ